MSNNNVQSLEASNKMLPYTMEVEIQNDSSLTMKLHSWAAGHVDGVTEVKALGQISPRSVSPAIKFTKSGGTDGMSGGAFFSLSDTEMRVFMYVKMDGSVGGKISVGCSVNRTDVTVQEMIAIFEDPSEEGGAQSSSNTGIVKGSEAHILADVFFVTDKYPDARCRIQVRAFRDV